MRFDWSHEPPRLFVGGRDFTHRLRDEDVTQRVSSVAGIGGVRRVLVAQQQQIGREHPRLISEGRDQGSVVFPEARLKFYLEASPAVRARRRTLQRQQAGQPANEQEILQAIIERDRRDETRTDGPLICPSDAVRIDTSPLSLDAVIDRLEWEIRDAVDPMDLAPVRGGG